MWRGINSFENEEFTIGKQYFYVSGHAALGLMLEKKSINVAGNGTVRSIRHVVSRLFDQIFMTRSDERRAEDGKSGSKTISTLESLGP